MERSITIKYRFWSDDKSPVKKEHEEKLEAFALERINEMWNDGFTSGELNACIYAGDDTVDKDYSGWFDIKIVSGDIENIKHHCESVTSAQLSYLDGIQKPEKTRLLELAAAKSEGIKQFLGYRLRQYKYDNELSDEAFAEFLRVKNRTEIYDDMQRYYLLHMVIAPDKTDGDEYNAWLKQVLDYLRCDWEKLHEVIQYTYGKYT